MQYECKTVYCNVYDGLLREVMALCKKLLRCLAVLELIEQNLLPERRRLKRWSWWSGWDGSATVLLACIMAIIIPGV